MKVVKEKQHITCRETMIQLIDDFSSDTVETRKHQNDIVRC